MKLDKIEAQLDELRSLIIRSHMPEIMKPAEAAEALGITVDTLFSWRKDGNGPKYVQPTPRIVRYTRTDVLAWMQEHRV
jgi:predicted DNA-binding transcriptional regulator AlpA